MEMTQITSSNIKKAGYEDGKMRVQFSNGTEYDYAVSIETYNSFLAAKSQGKYFNVNIRGKYNGVKVIEEDSNDERKV